MEDHSYINWLYSSNSISLAMLKDKNRNTARATASKASSDVAHLYSVPLPASRSGALFNAFSYPTKISPESIALFIATHTRPGDVVLDTFAGSGTTGLAALLCDRPTPELIDLAAAMKLQPAWGPRKAILYELGTLGSFVARTMCRPPHPHEFTQAANELLADVEAAVGNMYEATDPNGSRGQIRHVIWSDVLVCPSCKSEHDFITVAVKKRPLRFIDEFVCPACKFKAELGNVERAKETKRDPLLGKKVTTKKRVPAIIYGQTHGKNWKRPATDADQKLIRAIEKKASYRGVPIKAMEWGDLQRKGYHEGITHVHQFYTRRNLIVFNEIWKRIENFCPELRDALRLLALSYNSSHGTLMTRVVAKKGQEDFILTGAQSGVLYISSLPVEKNLIKGIRRKVQTFKDAFSQVHQSKSQVIVKNTSSTRLDLKSNSVDYVFTDPPFGDYIPYAELNQINEAWLGELTDRREEIIVSRAQKKTVDAYADLMQKVFKGIGKALKKNGKATLVFHSARPEVWRAVVNAYTSAGLNVKASSVLDKLQPSFKQTNSGVSVKGDPLILLSKEPAKRTAPTKEDTRAIVKLVINNAVKDKRNLKEKTVERLYSRYITHCLEMGVDVKLNAETFYAHVRNIPALSEL